MLFSSALILATGKNPSVLSVNAASNSCSMTSGAPATLIRSFTMSRRRDVMWVGINNALWGHLVARASRHASHFPPMCTVLTTSTPRAFYGGSVRMTMTTTPTNNYLHQLQLVHVADFTPLPGIRRRDHRARHPLLLERRADILRCHGRYCYHEARGRLLLLLQLAKTKKSVSMKSASSNSIHFALIPRHLV